MKLPVKAVFFLMLAVCETALGFRTYNYRASTKQILRKPSCTQPIRTSHYRTARAFAPDDDDEPVEEKQRTSNPVKIKLPKIPPFYVYDSLRFSGELMSICLGIDIVFFYTVFTQAAVHTPAWAAPLLKTEIFTNPTFVSLLCDMLCLTGAHTFVNWWTGLLARRLVVRNEAGLQEFSLNQFVITTNVFILGRLIWTMLISHTPVNVNHDVAIMSAGSIALYCWRYFYLSNARMRW
jgi:hypothetical protein